MCKKGHYLLHGRDLEIEEPIFNIEYFFTEAREFFEVQHKIDQDSF